MPKEAAETGKARKPFTDGTVVQKAGSGYQVPAVQDDQWEDSREFYAASVENAQLRYITDIVEYLEAIR